jgi:hypothetical protein
VPNSLYGLLPRIRYRLDLTNAAGNAGACATMLTVGFGPIVSTLDYNHDGLTGDQVFVTTVGGVGTIGLASASQTGRLITFHFQTPVCPGALPGGGKSSGLLDGQNLRNQSGGPGLAAGSA